MITIDKFFDASNQEDWSTAHGKYITSYRFPSESIDVHFFRGANNEVHITETSAQIIPISIVQRMTTLAIREFEADEMSFYDLQNCKFIRYKCRY